MKIKLAYGAGVLAMCASLGPSLSWAAGNEARCAELNSLYGAGTCKCSEPLNTSTYVEDTGSYWNPADTTTNQCTQAPGFVGTVLEDGSGFRYTIESSGVMFTALPNKSASITRILRTNEGGGGQFLGDSTLSSTFTGRRSFRWYEYFASNFVHSPSGSCANSGKLVQFGHIPSLSAYITQASGDYAMNGWTGWNIGSFSCCASGGPAASAVLSANRYDESEINGKWWRYEFVVDHPLTSGPTPTTWKLYVKNVTDDLPEFVGLDTTVPTPQAGAEDDWTSTEATTLKPTASNLDQIFIDAFRNPGGSCPGYLGFSHLLFASWSEADAASDPRIGAAEELEGASDVSGTLALFLSSWALWIEGLSLMGALWHWRTPLLRVGVAVVALSLGWTVHLKSVSHQSYTTVKAQSHRAAVVVAQRYLDWTKKG